MAEKLMADNVQKVVEATIRSALEGETAAQKIILDRIAPARKGRPVPIDLPQVTDVPGVLQALGVVIAAMGRGEVSPEEAQAMCAAIVAPKGVLEGIDMDRRLEAIEQRLSLRPAPPPAPPPPEGEEP